MKPPVPRAGTPISRWKALGQSVGAVHAPFGIMVIGTLLFVPCPHCKQAVCEILPLAPGLMPSWLLLTRFSNHLPKVVLWLSCGVFDFLAVAGLALVIRRGGHWKWAGMIATLLIASALAALTLMLIRA